jgi:hypothetical protein
VADEAIITIRYWRFGVTCEIINAACEDDDMRYDVRLRFYSLSTVKVYFIDRFEDSDDMREATSLLCRNAETLEDKVFAALRERHQQITSKDELAKIITLREVYVDAESSNIGLLFSFEYDREHGLGIRLRDWDIMDIGSADICFSF